MILYAAPAPQQEYPIKNKMNPSDEERSDDLDDITILHDEQGNPLLSPLGSPPEFHFLSEAGGKSASGNGAQDSAGSTVALKTAYDHLSQQYGQLRKHVKVLTDKNQQMTMLAKVGLWAVLSGSGYPLGQTK